MKPHTNILPPAEAADVIKPQHHQQSGYDRCIRDVNVFLRRSDGVPVEFQTRLLTYLANRSQALSNQEITRVHGNIADHPQQIHSTLPCQDQQRHPNLSVTPLPRHRSMQPCHGAAEQQKQVPTNTDYRCHVIKTEMSPPSFSQRPPSSFSPMSPPSDDCSTPRGIRNVTPIPLSSPHAPSTTASSLNYMSSSDSGNWSAGSNPPSPVPAPQPFHITEDALLRQSAGFASLWRPWGM